MAETTISEAKQAIRERVWTELEAAGAARAIHTVRGRGYVFGEQP